MPPATVTLKGRQENKYIKAKRALRSLAISIAIPSSLTMAAIFMFGSSRHYPSASRPLWVAPLWLVHLLSLCSSSLMGLAGWLVWADGGFRSNPDALPLYLSHLALLVVWDPLVLVMRAPWVALVFCAIDVATLLGCYWYFRRVNPFAKDLVKPCLAWAVYLCAVTYMLLDL